MVINEITQEDIEQKHKQMKESETPIRLGHCFLTIIEFLEKASSTFSGFPHDINQTILDIDFYDYIFDILEYFDMSDFLHQKVFKITSNIINDKSEEVHEMLQVLFD